MSVKSELKKLASVYDITPTKKTVRGILGEIAVALGGSGNGKTIAQQIYNIALAKGYQEPDEEEIEPEIGS